MTQFFLNRNVKKIKTIQTTFHTMMIIQDKIHD